VPKKERDKFPYDHVYGFFAVWMNVLSILILNNYVFQQPSATAKPYVYWAVSGWTMTPIWFFSWAIWLTNLIWDNKGGSIHSFFAYWTIIYMIMPVLFQPVFLILTFFGYGDTTLPRASDSKFWVYWLLFLGSDLGNLVLFYYTVYGLQF
jgi:hypothetical protein